MIVEDAAQAHGATYRGRRAGQFGPAMFSLYATKNLMTGEGGFATTDDDGVADRLRLYRNHGMRVRYHHESLGTNFKPTDLAAAHRPRPAARASTSGPRSAAGTPPYLTAQLSPDYLTPTVPEGREHVWHQYVMRFPGERQQVIDGLAERGIGTLIYYPVPVHRQAYLQAFVPGRRGPRPAGHRPPVGRGPLDPGPPEPDARRTSRPSSPRSARSRRRWRGDRDATGDAR